MMKVCSYFDDLIFNAHWYWFLCSFDDFSVESFYGELVYQCSMTFIAGLLMMFGTSPNGLSENLCDWNLIVSED